MRKVEANVVVKVICINTCAFYSGNNSGRLKNDNGDFYTNCKMPNGENFT